MARIIRKKSASGIYHIVFRGINKQVIFNDEQDYRKIKEILGKAKEISKFELYGYCLMSNHVHLLLKAEEEDIGQIMKRIEVRYVQYYNWKYSRGGHLFQDRYKSEPVETDEYLTTVLRYIHQNPVKANITKDLTAYGHSSYSEYIGKSDINIADTKLVMELIGQDNFTEFHKGSDEKNYLDESAKSEKLSDQRAWDIISSISKCKTIEDFQRHEIQNQLGYIKIARTKGLSIRQISRLTGVSVGLVRK